MRSQRRTQAGARTRDEVEALLVERFAREAEPPPGRAEADQPAPPGSPAGPPHDGDLKAGRTRDGLVDCGDKPDPDNDDADAA
jgi:hypothetical protein